MASTQKYVDHPAPSVALVVLLMVGLIGVVSLLPRLSRELASRPPSAELALVVAAISATVVLLAFYFWPIYTTYYTISDAGIEIRYGPWKRRYAWSDFCAAYWQRGMFATRIGWPSVTPCVRMTDAVLLKRSGKRFGLYLTPNDTRAFLQRLGEFAPGLTSEVIIQD